MDHFSQKTVEEIRYYVYALIDPRDGKIFYIGKGKGNRVFAHIYNALENPVESDKISLIKEILSAGQRVKHYILRSRIEDENVAFVVESVLIDLLTFPDFQHLSRISNIANGHHVWDEGIRTASEIESLWASEPLNKNDIRHNILLININRTYRRGVSPYEATRKYWKLSSERIKNVNFVCGEYRGIIRGIYRPDRWGEQEGTGRMYFEGTEVTDPEILKLYLNKEYQNKKTGQSNPVRYLQRNGNE